MCSEVMLVGQRFARRPDKGHIWLCAFAAAAGQGAHATLGSLGLACCDLLPVTHSVAIFSCLAATLLRACLADRLDLGACVFRCKCAAGAPHQAHCAILPRPAAAVCGIHSLCFTELSRPTVGPAPARDSITKPLVLSICPRS